MLPGHNEWIGRNAEAARILVVDDDPGIREVLEEALSRRGYHVRAVPDGRWVSRALRRGRFAFDLVILDWKMPGRDGLAVLRELRTAAQETPVIMLSVAADDRLRLVAVGLGAFEVLRKPIDFAELSTVVQSALQWSREAGHQVNTARSRSNERRENR